MKCRHCKSDNLSPFADLGSSPPSNAYLREAELQKPELWFPLRVFTCHECWLVQTEDFADYELLFNKDYAYFSSISKSWLQHAEDYVSAMVTRFELSQNSHVVEIAANDGYLLQFVKLRGIPCLGVEPTTRTAEAARQKGIEIVEEFFGQETAQKLVSKGKSADLIAAKNVLAHVPDIVDFMAGFEVLLKPQGVATFEFPHVLNLVKFNQFDTIYHEHFSYLSLIAVEAICQRVGLTVFDVEQISTHGGSLRVFVQKQNTGAFEKAKGYHEVLNMELAAGIDKPDFYQNFQVKCEKVKDDFLSFLLQAKAEGKTVCGYGAAAKGNTLINFAGIRRDLISFIADKAPSKQGKFMPGSRIPIVHEQELKSVEPDYVVILPWNLSSEIASQLGYLSDSGTELVTFVPEFRKIRIGKE